MLNNSRPERSGLNINSFGKERLLKNESFWLFWTNFCEKVEFSSWLVLFWRCGMEHVAETTTTSKISSLRQNGAVQAKISGSGAVAENIPNRGAERLLN